MKKYKKIKTLVAIFFASMLMVSGPAHAVAVIDSLDFQLTGISIIDCEILGNVELERDPSWSDEEFFARLVEKYNAEHGKSVSFDYDGTRSSNNYDILANYCIDEHGLITTTYNDNGYYGFIKLGDREISIGEDDIDTVFIDNGYIYHEDDFVDFKVEFERVDATTVKAKYTIKNLTGNATNYGVGFYADVEFGDNDEAAISKTDRDFTITQDNSSEYYRDTFGAQFKIELDPVPTTTFIGDYRSDVKPHWESSEVTYYTAADDIDTVLSYSWQGQIGIDESKNFTATYTIGVVDSFNNNFYYLSNEYAEPLSTVSAIDGGAIRLPYVDDSTPRQGYHREWNTKSDGKGINYASGKTIIANKNQTNYYEVEVPNGVIVEPGYSDPVISEQNIVLTEEMKEKYEQMAAEGYSNVSIYSEFFELPAEWIAYLEEEGTLDREKFVEPLGEDFEYATLLGMDSMGKTWIDQDGEYQNEDLSADEFPVTIRLKLTDEMRAGKTNFGITRATQGEEGIIDYVALPSTYNPATGELFFTIDNTDEFYYYAICSSIIPVVPDVPDTGMNVAKASVIASTTLLPALLLGSVLVLRRLNYRKNQQDS